MKMWWYSSVIMSMLIWNNMSRPFALIKGVVCVCVCVVCAWVALCSSRLLLILLRLSFVASFLVFDLLRLEVHTPWLLCIKK